MVCKVHVCGVHGVVVVVVVVGGGGCSPISFHITEFLEVIT